MGDAAQIVAEFFVATEQPGVFQLLAVELVTEIRRDVVGEAAQFISVHEVRFVGLVVDAVRFGGGFGWAEWFFCSLDERRLWHVGQWRGFLKWRTGRGRVSIGGGVRFGLADAFFVDLHDDRNVNGRLFRVGAGCSRRRGEYLRAQRERDFEEC